MSSRILSRSLAGIERLTWRRAGSPDPSPEFADPGAGEGPVTPAIDFEAYEAERGRLEQMIAGLEANLVDAHHAASDREARALEIGRREGFETGRQAGVESTNAGAAQAVEAAQAEATERAAAAAAQAVDLRRRLRQQMEADLVRLAIAVARRIVRRELSVDPEALMGIVKSAVERIAAREVLAIRVSPQDAPRVSARLADLRLPDRVEVIADSSLPWGSVVFDTARGQHDASVETQIEEIDRGLADLVGRTAK